MKSNWLEAWITKYDVSTTMDVHLEPRKLIIVVQQAMKPVAESDYLLKEYYLDHLKEDRLRRNPTNIDVRNFASSMYSHIQVRMRELRPSRGIHHGQPAKASPYRPLCKSHRKGRTERGKREEP
eukprot:4193751-Amphidinium_carterae.1